MNTSLLFRISLLGLIFLGMIFSFSTSVFSSDNITKPGFIIPLGAIDPINPGAAIPTGKEAVTTLLENIASLLLFLVPIIAGVSLVIAGYYYILSGGDSEKATQAKTIIKWNLVAIAVAVSSYALIRLIASLLDGTI